MIKPRPVRLKTPLLAVVCRKCVKRIGGGKAGKQLTRALRARLDQKVQAAEIGCVKLCPKRHVVVVPINGAPHIVPAENWADAAAALIDNLAVSPPQSSE